MLEEEYPQVPFSYRDEEGNVIFRDALVFSSMAELRSTSKEEREVMMEERYQNWLVVKSTPGVDAPEEE